TRRKYRSKEASKQMSLPREHFGNTQETAHHRQDSQQDQGNRHAGGRFMDPLFLFRGSAEITPKREEKHPEHIESRQQRAGKAKYPQQRVPGKGVRQDLILREKARKRRD